MNIFGLEINITCFNKKHLITMLKQGEVLKAYDYLHDKTGWGNYKVNEYIVKIQREFKLASKEELDNIENILNQQKQYEELIKKSAGKMVATNTLERIQ